MFHTGTAGRACPELIFLDNMAHERRNFLELASFFSGFDELRTSLRHMVFQVIDDFLWRERFFSQMGWTMVLTPATSGAGIKIHQLLHSELFYLGHSKAFCFFILQV
jgi:hypothetical protein